jgi:phosphoesterase RecJ-like protein
VMEAGADVEKLNARLFESRSHARITAERMAMESLEYYFNDLCAVICLTWDQIESSGVAGAELEDLTSLPRSIEGVEVGLTYRQQRDGSFRISVRTSGSIDACNIARRLGGGGHTRAAGCEISGNLDNAKHAVLEEVRKELQRCGLLDQDAG